MPLGNPEQGQRIASIVDELVRKDEEREAAAKRFNLDEFMQGTEADVARNAQEWERRKAERDRLQLEGQVAFNQREEEDRNIELNRRLNQQFPMSLSEQ